jgi:hypothetical protein
MSCSHGGSAGSGSHGPSFNKVHCLSVCREQRLYFLPECGISLAGLIEENHCGDQAPAPEPAPEVCQPVASVQASWKQ